MTAADARDARWQALKDDLAKRIDGDARVFQGYMDDGDTAGAAPFGALLAANRHTLSKMQELER
jgi:hypothetical protein